MTKRRKKLIDFLEEEGLNGKWLKHRSPNWHGSNQGATLIYEVKGVHTKYQSTDLVIKVYMPEHLGMHASHCYNFNLNDHLNDREATSQEVEKAKAHPNAEIVTQYVHPFG